MPSVCTEFRQHENPSVSVDSVTCNFMQRLNFEGPDTERADMYLLFHPLDFNVEKYTHLV